MRSQIQLWVINCSECPHDCHITQAPSNLSVFRFLNIPKECSAQCWLAISIQQTTWTQFMKHENSSCCLLQPCIAVVCDTAGHQGWAFLLASTDVGWQYLRAGKGWHHGNWNPVGYVQTLWPSLSTSHLVLDEAIKVNIFATVLTLRHNSHCPMCHLRQQSNLAVAAVWGQCKEDCYRGGAAGGEAVPQRKLQHGSWEKIRQCNLIIFQQLHAAGYGCLLDVSA